ncbi:MAG: 16S rRNA (cytidine(1402)-2'-O)-methyltransferase [Chlamydiales bacterium]|nr:16S rRNA (cytidine(1402)-2'-O)-methyltransferase [Chlamydiales bacterium]
MLTLVSTPIGNLKDISLRALEALKECDCILCEDTRHSKILLNAHGIDRPLMSYHQFNEKKRIDELMERIEAGETFCLISDAGTPGICDPGQILIDACHDRGIAISIIPGPCAFASALAVCGFQYERAQFGGFLAKKEGERKMQLISALAYQGVSLFYETPHQIAKTLSDLEKLDAKRKICLVRELTKKFEEVVRGTAKELQSVNAKGEFCLVISKGEVDWSFEPKMFVKELMQSFNLTVKDAIKIAADLGRISRQDLYRDWHS